MLTQVYLLVFFPPQTTVGTVTESTTTTSLACSDDADNHCVIIPSTRQYACVNPGKDTQFIC